MSYAIFLDDERFPVNENDYIIIRTAEEAIRTLEKRGLPNYVSFDHDLGENIKTGYDYAKHICNNYDLTNNVIAYTIHSMNPVGKKNIKEYLDGVNRFYKKEIWKYVD